MGDDVSALRRLLASREMWQVHMQAKLVTRTWGKRGHARKTQVLPLYIIQFVVHPLSSMNELSNRAPGVSVPNFVICVRGRY